MESIKRLTALLLAMAMSMSLLSANVWAAEESADASVSDWSSESLMPEESPSEDESEPEAQVEEEPAIETEHEENSLEEEEILLQSEPDGAASSEDPISQTHTNESKIELNENKKLTITGFADFDIQSHYLVFPINQKPSEDELVSQMPKKLDVYLNGDKNLTSIDVTWFHIVGNYEESTKCYFQFSPQWDEEQYELASDIDLLLDGPYIGVFLTEDSSLNTQSVTGNANETAVFNFFRNDMGCNVATACGVLANIQQESGFNPQVKFLDTNGLYSYGLCQWNGARYTALQNFSGSAHTTVDGQLRYLKHELESSESNAWSKMQGIEDSSNGAYTAGYNWARYFERCAEYYNGRAQYVERGNLARDKYWPEYSRDILPPTPTISGANSPGTLTVGSVFSIKGTVSCGQSLTNVTAGVYDADGNMKTGKSASPNSTSYNIVGLDNEVYFNHLSPGVYRYKVSATASGKTTVLVTKDFIVLAKSDTVSPGTYMIEPCGNSAVVADVGDNSSNVLLENKCSRDSQLFEITSIGNGYYHIKNVETGKMLDVSGAGSAPETNVQIYEANDSPAQNWQILPVMDGYALVPQCGTSNCLDVYNAAFNNGANLQVYTAHLSNLAQRFRLKTVTKSPVSGKGNRIAFDMQGGTVSEPIKTMSVSGLNTRRTTQALVIYSIEGLKPFTNHYGREASVDSSGKVTAIREYDSDTQLTVPSGGFIISGHTDYGKGGIEFVNTLSVGTYVGYNAETKVASAYRDRNSYLIENKYVDNGGTYGDLPAPHKNGYTFTGWYTSAQGGSRIRKSGTYSANKLYAHWEKTGEEKAASEQTYQGHRYELYDYLMTWEEANAFCQAKGGHLATIASSQENEIVANLVPKSESAWIGATDKAKEGTFGWATGESFTYTNWSANEPNDYGGNEDYSEMESSGTWNDNSSTALRPFICEYDTEKSTNSISYCSVTLSETSYAYDGKAKTPFVTVRDGSKTLAKGTDYEASYRNNVEVGTATVTITGKGNYTGSVERTFTITKENTPAGAAVFTVGSVSAAPGGQITVPVSITKNPGIAGFALDISYDRSLLTLTNVAAVSALGGTFTQNSNTVTWYSDGNVNRTGKAFELTFTVSGNADDTQTDVSLSMHDGKQNVTDENYANVTTSFEKGTVTIRSSGTPGDVTGDNDVTIADVVKVNRHVAGRITLTGAELLTADVTGDGDVTIADVVKINRFVSGRLDTLAVASGLITQAAGDVTITVGSVSASAGKTVSIPVNISGNSGIAGMALEFNIPSGMKLNSITAGDVLKDGAFTQNGNTITWYAPDNVYRDGVILKLNVTVPESSGSYTVRAALKDGKASNLSNESSNSVGVSFEAGTVNVSGGATSTLAKTKLSSVKFDKKKKIVTVKWKKNTKGKGYEVEYSTDKKFKKSVKTVKISKNKTVKTTVKKLKKGTWYFRIRTVKGKSYSGWSAVKKVKVTK